MTDENISLFAGRPRVKELTAEILALCADDASAGQECADILMAAVLVSRLVGIDEESLPKMMLGAITATAHVEPLV